MPLNPRSAARILLTAALLLVSGCYHQPSSSFERSALVGTYVFRSAGGPPIHAPDRLTLKADGTYLLVHMPGGHPDTIEKGTWQLYDDPSWGGGPQVGFGRGSYPIRVKGNHVRLLIDLDLGYWYEKTGGSPSQAARISAPAKR